MSTLYRTYSSPKLSYDFDEEFFVVGDRVYVDGFRPASVAYFGEVEFAGGDWVGVVLDHPTGNHEGKVHGREYFQCASMHGLFVRPRRITRMPDSAIGSSNASSRVSTPLPSFQQGLSGRRSCNSRSSGGSALDSYFYDEDYRQDKEPTIASLTRKLRSLNNMSNTNTRGGGILKRGPRSRSTEPMSISSKSEELNRRLNQVSQSPSVFNFRPRRAKLEEFEINRSATPPEFYSQNSDTTLVDLSSQPLSKGDRVIVRPSVERGEMTGILRYLGETDFATGEWAGIELDRADGKNDGSVLGRRYFHCPANYGLFVPALRVRKYEHSTTHQQPEFTRSVKSTIKSPPPLMSTYYGSRSTTPSSTRLSLSPSYYSSPAHSGYSYSSPDHYATSLFDEKPKFDDKDIDILLKKSIMKPLSGRHSSSLGTDSYRYQPSKHARSIKYTFASSKYDGNPIARRTVEYN